MIPLEPTLGPMDFKAAWRPSMVTLIEILVLVSRDRDRATLGDDRGILFLGYFSFLGVHKF